MDSNLLFSLIHSANSSSQLFEKYTLSWFTGSGEICRKKNKKQTLVKHCLKPIKLSDTHSLVILAPLQLFFLAHSILVGEHTQLKQAKKNYTQHWYIFDESISEYIDEFVDSSTIEKYLPKDLFELPISWDYSRPPVVEEIGVYVYEQKNLSLDKIHIVKGKTVELFTPTANYSHYAIAKDMNIPLIPLLAKGFLNETPYHIFNTNELEKALKPLLTTSIKLNQFVSLKGEILYRDIEKQLHINLDQSYLLDRVSDMSIIHTSQETLQSYILSASSIQIGSQYEGDIQIPFWKDGSSYITFKTAKEFEDFSGISYDSKKQLLDSVYLVDRQGNKLFYPNYCVFSKLNLFNQPSVAPILHFKNKEDFLIQLELLPKEFTGVVRVTPTHWNKVDEIFSIIHKLITWLVYDSIETVKFPKASLPKSTQTYYMSHIIDAINGSRKAYISNSQGVVLDETHSCVQTIWKYRAELICDETKYFFLEFIRECLETLRFFNEKKASSYQEFLENYFSSIRSRTHLPLDDDTFSTYSLYIFAKKLAKQNAVYVVLKTNEFNDNFDFATILDSSQADNWITKLDVYKLKQLVPHSSYHLISEFNSSKTLPETYTRGKTTISLPKNNLLYSLPIFSDKDVKGISKDFIIYVDKQ